MVDQYTIGKLSKISAVSPRTIRFYGEIGLLNCSKNADTNYRFYCEEDLKRLEQILLFKSLGFSLDDIKVILSSTNNKIVDEVFNRKLDKLEDEISELIHCKEVLIAIGKIYKASGLEYLNNHQLIREMSYMNNTFIKTFDKLDVELQIKVLTELYHTGSLSHETIKKIGSEPGSRILNELHMTIIKSILNKVDRNTEKNLMKNLEKIDSKLAEEIKSALFTFEDIVMLSDKTLEKWLVKCDDKDIIIALKESSKYVIARIFSNMPSERISQIKNLISESEEPTLDESYISMKKLIEILKQMDFSGEITTISEIS
jgi:DNA-binding transcriptional MerR regulator